MDFLRGLFVLGILVYHVVPGAPVGLGQGSMEGFFCLSGFLITRTLLRRLPRGWPGLVDFALNRLRRLMPALLLYLGLVGFLNVCFKRADLGLVLKSIGFSVLGFYNWFLVIMGQPLPGLGGIWSLSVEDQFYMLLMTTAALLLGLRLERKKAFCFLMLYLLFLVTSLSVRVGNAVWWTDQSPSSVSYLTPQRLWAFGWGGIAALAVAFRLVAHSIERPHRQNAPLHEAAHPVGSASQGRLRVLEPTGTYIKTLNDLAKAHGFKPGDPVLDLTGRYPATLFLMEAVPVASAWLCGGYLGSEAVAMAALDRVDASARSRMWILLEPNGPRSFDPAFLRRYGIEIERDYRGVGSLSAPTDVPGELVHQQLLKPGSK